VFTGRQTSQSVSLVALSVHDSETDVWLPAHRASWSRSEEPVSEIDTLPGTPAHSSPHRSPRSRVRPGDRPIGLVVLERNDSSA
jgi:hypothetical protein